MHASVLGAVGEPLELFQTDGETQAVYPLPYGQRLMVSYSDAGLIGFLSTYSSPDAAEAPRTSGLRLEQMTLSQVLAQIGANGGDLAMPGLVHLDPLSARRFSLIYDIEGAPEAALILDFVAEPDSDLDAPAVQRRAELSDAQFIAASLVLRDGLSELRASDGFPGGPRAAPIPFPMALDEAFPSLIRGSH